MFKKAAKAIGYRTNASEVRRMIYRIVGEKEFNGKYEKDELFACSFENGMLGKLKNQLDEALYKIILEEV